ATLSRPPSAAPTWTAPLRSKPRAGRCWWAPLPLRAWEPGPADRIEIGLDFPSFDVLVIGGGAAGLRAAIAAAETERSLRIGIVSKVYPMRSHTVSAEGGAAAALRPEDSWETHAYDTIKGSDYIADQYVVETFVREAPTEVVRLEHWGCPWSRDPDGKIGAKSVILTTGGNGRIYAFTTNGNICTGDGMALAYRAGVPLKDMEMVQFHPTGLPATGILITEAVRGEGGYLINNKGERFLKD